MRRHVKAGGVLKVRHQEIYICILLVLRRLNVRFHSPSPSVVVPAWPSIHFPFPPTLCLPVWVPVRVSVGTTGNLRGEKAKRAS
jgi:hypothetical protein